MNVAIVGSRSLENRLEDMIDVIPDYLKKGDTIVSGGAVAGADHAAQVFAKRFGRTITIHYPAWNEHGKQAGFIRNQLIVDDADLVLAFWDGESRGTKHTIATARAQQVPTVVLVADPLGDFNQIEID